MYSGYITPFLVTLGHFFTHEKPWLKKHMEEHGHLEWTGNTGANGKRDHTETDLRL